jgi:hypothetical protein
VVIYRGRAEWRQERGRIDGRADVAQADGGVGREIASIEVDLAATIATKAASSSLVGVPRTTLTRGSSSIDRAYDLWKVVR